MYYRCSVGRIDPFNYDDYLAKCTFLPDINNELPVKNATYKVSWLEFAVVCELCALCASCAFECV